MVKCKCGKEFEGAQSLNAHYRWCLTHREGKPVASSPNKGKVSPFRGITLEDQVGKERNKSSLRKLERNYRSQD